MRFELGLGQKLALEQRLTPQLILNLRLLQMPMMELEELVRKEMEENPALENGDEPSASDDGGQPESGDENRDGSAPSGEPSPVGDESRLADGRASDDINVDYFFPDVGVVPSSYEPRGRDEIDAVELAPAPGPGLSKALMPRIKSLLGTEDALVAETVFDSLNEDGFLVTDLDEFAASQGISSARLRRILHVIQRFEPGGLGCRDQREAFLIQLELLGYPPDSLECRIVAEHWMLLLQAQVDRLARKCGVDETEIRHAIDAILTLEPKPARRYSNVSTEYVTPDFAVIWMDGRLVAEANESNQPRLRLARRYVEMLRNPKAFPREQVRFAREKFNRALMFLRGIESRRRTLRRLMELILEDQGEFFRSGPQFLRPATLRAAAGRLGVHPSTASRATHGKYVETQYGIFPMKHFFKAGAGDRSRAGIKRKIELIIENEDKSSPLSDDEIGEVLSREGIKIARRTVAKYRNELGLPGRNRRGRL